MNEINHIKGMRAESMVILRALDRGYIVSKPVSAYSRYDILIDDGVKIQRVQIKYAGSPMKNGAVKVHLEKKNRNNTFRYTREEIDLLLLVFTDRNMILSFGPDLFHNKSALMVRFEPSKNGREGHWFENFVW